MGGGGFRGGGMVAPRSFGGMNRGYAGARSFGAPSMGMARMPSAGMNRMGAAGMGRSFAGSAAGRGFGVNAAGRNAYGVGARAPINDMGGRSFASSNFGAGGWAARALVGRAVATVSVHVRRSTAGGWAVTGWDRG